MPSGHQAGSGDNHSLTSPAPFGGNRPHGFRTPSLDNTTYILILLVVLVPIIFTIILCAITYCIYRYNKNQSARAPTNARIAAADRSSAPITVIYNNQHSPFTLEDSPPSYDSLLDIKKDPHSRTTNTNEQFPLIILPNTTLTNSNEEVTAAAAILPTAPILPLPPSYINLDERNK